MKSTDADGLMRELAAKQHGLVARRQLRAAGVTPELMARRVRQGALLVLSRRVFRQAGSPSTPESAVMAGVLDAGPGAAASFGTAAGLWGLPGFDLLPVEVTGRRPRVTHRAQDLSIVHQPRLLHEAHVTELDHIPVTTPTRMVFDLAGTRYLHPRRVERMLDTCWSRSLVSHRSLARMLGELRGRGRPGITLMRELLGDRPPEFRPPASNLERRFQEVAARAGLDAFVRQLDVGSDDRWIGRVDFIDRERRIIVEVDSALYHGSLTDRRADDARYRDLADAGFHVLSFDDDDLFRRADVVVTALRSANSRFRRDQRREIVGIVPPERGQ